MEVKELIIEQILTVLAHTKYIYVNDEDEGKFVNKRLLEYIGKIGKENPLHITPSRNAKNKLFNIGIRTIARIATTYVRNDADIKTNNISSSEVRALLVKCWCIKPKYIVNRVYIVPKTTSCIVDAVRQLIVRYKVLPERVIIDHCSSYVDLTVEKQYYCLHQHREEKNVRIVYEKLTKNIEKRKYREEIERAYQNSEKGKDDND